jgi:hypothetical protein
MPLFTAGDYILLQNQLGDWQLYSIDVVDDDDSYYVISNTADDSEVRIESVAFVDSAAQRY